MTGFYTSNDSGLCDFCQHDYAAHGKDNVCPESKWMTEQNARIAQRSHLKDMYAPYEHELAAFGNHWCGPKVYKSWEPTLVARYPSDDDSDGQTVEVWCTAAPARFYDIIALSGPNSVGEQRKGYAFATGSGQARLAAMVAKAISEDMLSLSPPKPESNPQPGEPPC